MSEIVNNIFSVTEENFQAQAMAVFHYQYANNDVYKAWADALNLNVQSITTINKIPFLPVSFFKHHKVTTGRFRDQTVFTSSGTSGSLNSSHHVKLLSVYIDSFLRGFNLFYGDPSGWCIIGLLPSYLERQGSSLVVMVDHLIKKSTHPESGFYLYEFDKLSSVLEQLESAGQKTLVVGVTFALLDFAERFPMKLEHTVIMETGGMKGRKREMIREEVHAVLRESFGVPAIHSEYGMTELLSQAYSYGDGIFNTVPWMKVLVRDEDDPFYVRGKGRGVLNIIDLANINSCSFIATDDVGIINEDGSFEVLGRMDESDVRGCSLMVV